MTLHWSIRGWCAITALIALACCVVRLRDRREILSTEYLSMLTEEHRAIYNNIWAQCGDRHVLAEIGLSAVAEMQREGAEQQRLMAAAFLLRPVVGTYPLEDGDLRHQVILFGGRVVNADWVALFFDSRGKVTLMHRGTGKVVAARSVVTPLGRRFRVTVKRAFDKIEQTDL